ARARGGGAGHRVHRVTAEPRARAPAVGRGFRRADDAGRFAGAAAREGVVFDPTVFDDEPTAVDGKDADEIAVALRVERAIARREVHRVERGINAERERRLPACEGAYGAFLQGKSCEAAAHVEADGAARGVERTESVRFQLRGAQVRDGARIDTRELG